MIGNVFNQAQKLFSRSFAIASFVPSLLFIMVAAYLFGGEVLNRELTQFKGKGWEWEKATPELMLSLGAVYLLAYVVYGIRAALHHLFQGHWPLPLRWLSYALLTKERWIWGRRKARLEQLVAARDAPDWALSSEDRFGRTFSHFILTPSQARTRLRTSRGAHLEILRCLRDGQKPSSRSYWHVLTDAHLLQANRRRLPAPFQEEVDRFVSEIRAAYETKDNVALRDAAQELKARTQRQWTEAYEYLMQDFPQDERFLQSTRLGNVAMVQELYTFNRYGIALSDLWPRLDPLLPEDTHRRIDEANTYLDFVVIMAFYSALAALLAGAAAFYGIPRPLWPKVLLVSAPVLCYWLFYWLAVQATRAFGLQIQAAVDLYRLKLLDALGVPRPESPEKERAIWEEFHYFIVQAVMPKEHFRFKSTAEAQVKT